MSTSQDNFMGFFPKGGVTILGDADTLAFNPTETCCYTDAGLVWACQRVTEMRALMSVFPNSIDRPSEICNACKKLASHKGEAELGHQPGLLALCASATRCDLCLLLLGSLNGQRHLSTLSSYLKNCSNEQGEDEDTVAEIRRSQTKPDQIIVFEHTSKNLVGRAPRRFQAVWRKPGVVGFQFPGDTIGIAQIQRQGLTSRAIWAGTNGEDYNARFDVLNEWMEQCYSQHPLCGNRDEKLLPSRVIDVGLSEGSDDVRLVTSTSRVGTYTALSYCWGSARFMTTTKKTLATRLQHISVKELSTTFQDAIKVTRKLKIPYLWIDALCIIQDDPEDWERESANMHAIFSNASVTLAATSADDCDGGLLLPFKPAFHGLVPELEDRAIRIAQVHSRPRHLPLHTRGWTLQEAYLSRRILNFTSRQVIWQCTSSTLSEDGMFDGTDEFSNKLPLIVHSLNTCGLSPQAQWYSEWKNVAEKYSQRRLTFGRDKIPALAGITLYFRDRLEDEPLVGLWRKDLIHGLLWKSNTPATGRPLTGIPSWSWLAAPHTIEYNKLYLQMHEDDRYEVIPKAEVPSVSISWKGVPLASELSDATLTLRGRMLKVHASWPTLPDTIYFDLATTDNPDDQVKRVFLDYHLDTIPSEVWCLHVATIEGSHLSSSHESKVCLVIAATGDKPQTFRRLSLVVVENRRAGKPLWEMLDRATVQTVDLV